VLCFLRSLQAGRKGVMKGLMKGIFFCGSQCRSPVALPVSVRAGGTVRSIYAPIRASPGRCRPAKSSNFELARSSSSCHARQRFGRSLASVKRAPPSRGKVGCFRRDALRDVLGQGSCIAIPYRVCTLVLGRLAAMRHVPEGRVAGKNTGKRPKPRSYEETYEGRPAPGTPNL
jgi:hypothetical protein